MRATGKPFNIAKKQVYEAYKAVKSNKGAAGVDGQTRSSSNSAHACTTLRLIPALGSAQLCKATSTTTQYPVIWTASACSGNGYLACGGVFYAAAAKRVG